MEFEKPVDNLVSSHFPKYQSPVTIFPNYFFLEYVFAEYTTPEATLVKLVCSKITEEALKTIYNHEFATIENLKTYLQVVCSGVGVLGIVDL